MLNNRYITVLNQYRKDINENVFSGHPMFFDTYINQFGKVEYKNVPKEGIYYTSEIVAENIIKNGIIWLNDIKNMNDHSEMIYSISYFQNILLGFYKDDQRNYDFLKAIEETFNEHKNKFNIEQNSDNEKLVLAMCFSQSEDDATMWDRYANKGNGVAIHFNLEKLYSVLNNAGVFFPNTISFEYGISQVCYPVNNQCNCFEKLYNDALEAYSLAKNRDELNVIRTFLHTHILELLMSHKHPSFRGEYEVRMYSQAPSRKTWSGSDHIHEHTQGNNTSNHMILNLHLESQMAGEEDLWRELILKVIVGPNTSEKTKENINNVLETKGLSDIMVESECPLRA